MPVFCLSSPEWLTRIFPDHAVGTPYGAAYGPGDTVGFLIHLPPTQSKGILPQRSHTSKAFAYKGCVYFEENEVADKSKVGGKWPRCIG